MGDENVHVFASVFVLHAGVPTAPGGTYSRPLTLRSLHVGAKDIYRIRVARVASWLRTYFRGSIGTYTIS